MISIKLKELIKQRGRTMTDVAAATGISMNTLSVLGRGESNGIQFETLDKICKELMCTPNDILDFKNSGYEFSMAKRPEKIKEGLLFSGELIPSQAFQQMLKTGHSGYTGYPAFIETSGVVAADGTIVLYVGMPKSAMKHFEARDTAATSSYSVKEATDFYKKMTSEDLNDFLHAAAYMVKKYLPAVSKATRAIAILAIDDGNTNPSLIVDLS